MDNIALPIENNFIDTQSRFRLAILAIQRAKQLIEGDQPTTQSRHCKSTTIAIEEILHGDLKIFYGKEAVGYQEEAMRIRKEKKNHYLSPDRDDELKREIKKDLSVYLADIAEKESSLKIDDSKDTGTDG
jgi:DNA-directed RNA polymerase subunit omega